MDFYAFFSLILAIFFIIAKKPYYNLVLLLTAIPFENSVTLTSSLSLIKAMSVLTFISFIFNSKYFIKHLFNGYIRNIYFILFWICFFISTATGIDQSFADILREITGWFQWFIILSIIHYYFKYVNINSLDQLENFLIKYGLIILVFIVVIQGPNLLTNRLYFGRYLGPNTLAILFTALLLLLYSIDYRNKMVIHFIGIIFFLAIISTGNRSMMIGLIIASLMLFFKFIRIINVKSILLIIAFLLVIFFPYKQDSFLFNAQTRIIYPIVQIKDYFLSGDDFEIGNEDYSYHTSIYRSSAITKENERIMLYQLAFMIANDNPIFGHGPGTLVYNNILNNVLDKQKNIHSTFLDILLKYGYVGLILSLLFFTRLLIRSFNASNTPRGIALFILLIGLSVDALFHTQYQDSIVLVFVSIFTFRLFFHDKNIKTNS